MTTLLRMIINMLSYMLLPLVITIVGLALPSYRKLGEIRAAYELGKRHGRKSRS